MKLAPWLTLSRRIDRSTVWLGQAVAWLVLAMVLIGAGNAVARYLGRWLGMNLSSNAYIEAQWYLFSLLFLLAGAYALRQDSHVRVDVFYSRLSRRGQAWIDLLGTLLFLLPFSLFGLWVSWPWVVHSWEVREVSGDPGGLVRYPLKAMVLVAFALLAVQGVSEAIKRIAVLWGGGEGDESGETAVPEQEASRG